MGTSFDGPPGLPHPGRLGWFNLFISNSESGRDRYRRLRAPSASPLASSGRGAAPPRFGQQHGFVEARPPSSQNVLLLPVLVISLDLVRILVQDLLILVLDI